MTAINYLIKIHIIFYKKLGLWDRDKTRFYKVCRLLDSMKKSSCFVFFCCSNVAAGVKKFYIPKMTIFFTFEIKKTATGIGKLLIGLKLS